MVTKFKQVSDWEEDCLKWRGKVLKGPDCHWCADWDGLPVSAFTLEYCACHETKTQVGRACNWLYMLWNRLHDWWTYLGDDYDDDDSI